MKAVGNFIEIFSGATEFTEVSTAAYGYDDALGGGGFGVSMVEAEESVPAFDFFNAAKGCFNACFGYLFIEFFQEGFLDLCGYLEVTGGSHAGGIGVDGFVLWKVRDGGEVAGGFEKAIVETGFMGLDGGGHTGYAGADDGKVEDVTASGSFLKIGFLEDGVDGFGSGVEGELEEGDAGEVTDDADAWEVGGSVFADFGEFFNATGGPFAMEPVNVFGEEGHKGIRPERPRNCCRIRRYIRNNVRRS